MPGVMTEFDSQAHIRFGKEIAKKLLCIIENLSRYFYLREMR